MQDGTPSCRHADAVVARYRRGNRIACTGPCTGFQVSDRVFFLFFFRIGSFHLTRPLMNLEESTSQRRTFGNSILEDFCRLVYLLHEREREKETIFDIIFSLWEIWKNRRRLTLITMICKKFLVDWFSGFTCEL